MPHGSTFQNQKSRAWVLEYGGDRGGVVLQNQTMAKGASTKPKFKHVWFLPEWLKALKLKPSDMYKPHEEGGLGWSKSKASLVYNGHQGYSQAVVDDICAWLHLRPHELLMHPERAMAFRGVERAASAIPVETPEAHPEKTRGAA